MSGVLAAHPLAIGWREWYISTSQIQGSQSSLTTNMGHPSWGEIGPGTLTTLQLLTWITVPALRAWGWEEVQVGLRLEVGDCG